MKLAVHEFAGHVSMKRRPRFARRNLSETMLANFYYYYVWPVQQIRPEDRLREIIRGKDDELDRIIIAMSPLFRNWLNRLIILLPIEILVGPSTAGDSTGRSKQTLRTRSKNEKLVFTTK